MSGRKSMLFVSLLVTLGLLIGACAPAAPATEAPAAPPEPAATEAPAPTEAAAPAGPIVVAPDAEGMIDTTPFATDPPYTICFSN
ncbi:MAG: hypothetical protein MUO23_08180, partial [Anaerolineales bacterium]|nr:hypothetical protein [Anaerolineales bacterium]